MDDVIGADQFVFGIVFVGPPGSFSIWETTPDRQLMDRDAVERLGQMAALAGAVDYRVFALEVGPEATGLLGVSDESHIDSYQELLNQCGGIPPATSLDRAE